MDFNLAAFTGNLVYPPPEGLPQMHAQIAPAGSSFSLPLRPGLPEPLFATDDYSDFQSMQPLLFDPSQLRQHRPDLLVAYPGTASASPFRNDNRLVSNLPLPASTSAAPWRWADDLNPTATTSVPPNFSSDGAAYLFRVLYEPPTMTNAVPPQTQPPAPPSGPTFGQPLVVPPPPIPPLLAPGNGAGAFGSGATPVAFQMRLSDLLAWTKAIRGVGDDAVEENAVDDVPGKEPSEDAQVAESTMKRGKWSYVSITQDNSLLRAEAAEDVPEKCALAEEIARSLQVLDAGRCKRKSPASDQETEEEEEVVTPCEADDLSLELPARCGLAVVKEKRDAADELDETIM